MADRPRKITPSDFLRDLIAANLNVDVKTAEAPAERSSRIRREEAEDAHKRRISLLVHTFVLVMVAGAFLVSSYVVIAKDPKTGLPDKAIGVITAIVAAGAGYITGKGSK